MSEMRFSRLVMLAVLLALTGLSCSDHVPEESKPTAKRLTIEPTKFGHFGTPKPHTVVLDHAEVPMPGQIKKTLDAFLLLAASPESKAAKPLEDIFSDKRALEYAKKLLQRLPKEAGDFDRVLDLSYRESYAGRYAQARCRWERGGLRLRFFVDEKSGMITGLWVARDKASRLPLEDFIKEDHFAGRGARDFHEKTHRLAIKIHIDPTKANFGGPIERKHWMGNLSLWRALPDHFLRLSDPEMRIQGLDGRVWQAFPINPNRRHEGTYPKWANYEFATEMPAEEQTVTIETLSAGDYCFVWNLGSGRLITYHFTLDGSWEVTEIELPLTVVPEVTIAFQDSKTGKVLNDRAFRPYLGPEINRGRKAKLSSWRYYETLSSESPDNDASWGNREWRYLGRSEIKPSQRHSGEYVYKNVPPGLYTVCLQSEAECIWRNDGLPETHIPLTVTLEGKNDFLITTDQLRDVTNKNIAIYVPSEARLKDSWQRSDRQRLIKKVPFSLLRYCRSPEFDRFLCTLLGGNRHGGGNDWSAFELAIEQFRKGYPVTERNVSGIATALSYANGSIKHPSPHSTELAEKCVTLLRDHEKTLGAGTEKPRSDLPPALRPFLADLHSKFAARRGYGLWQLGQLGAKARPALPDIRKLHNDDATAIKYEHEIDFDADFLTVSDIAADAIGRIETPDSNQITPRK